MPKKYLKPGQPKLKPESVLPDNWENIILEMSNQGCSDVEIRAHLCMLNGKFNHGTWYALKDREIEFFETVEKGKVLSQAWWERKGRENVTHSPSVTFETGLWSINMKNRFGWRDNPEVSLHLGEETFRQIADALAQSDTSSDKVLQRRTSVRN